MLEVGTPAGVRVRRGADALNVMDAHYRSFEKLVLPELVRQEHRRARYEADGQRHHPQSKTVSATECLRYALNLPTSVVITGIDSMKILNQACDVAAHIQPHERYRGAVTARKDGESGFARRIRAVQDVIDLRRHSRTSRMAWRRAETPSESDAVKPWEVLGETQTPDGTAMALTRRDREYVILANGKSLMSSLMHGSEEALATLACPHLRAVEEPSVLIGGLGMGFTLRATLDLLPPDASVTVAELVSAVVEWNRGPLGPLAGHPLKDKRVHVVVGDVTGVLASHRGRFDAVLLDVDNGPAPFTAAANAGLYDDRGLAAARAALKEQRRAGDLVGMGQPEIRAAPSLCRVRCGSRARPRPPEERRPASHYLPGARIFLKRSYSTTPPAVATFSERFVPTIGMRTRVSHRCTISAGRPSTSCPKTTSTGNRGCHSNRSTASSTVSIAAASQPARRRSSMIASGSARSHGTLCSEPSAVFAICFDGGEPVNPDR